MNREAYERILRSADARGLSLGSGGIHLHAAEALDEAQVGYAVDPGGQPLGGTGEGEWQPSWLVIGSETLCGDPLFVDLAQAGLPVLTAAHGMGCWEADPIADSAEAFFRALDVVRTASGGRERPAPYPPNPLPEAEREEVLRRIGELNPRSDLYFWRLLLESDF